MLTMMLAGAITVAALIVTMARINLKRCLGYSTAIDLTFTALMLYMFHGTFSGIVAAASAGLFMSLALTVLVKILGYERARVIRFHWMKMPDVEWIPSSPSGKARVSLDCRLSKARANRILHWLNS